MHDAAMLSASTGACHTQPEFSPALTLLAVASTSVQAATKPSFVEWNAGRDEQYHRWRL